MQLFWSKIDKPEVILKILPKMKTFIEKSSDNSRQNFLMPLLKKSLEMRHVRIQNLALKQVEILKDASLLMFTELKNDILPRVRVICLLKAPGNPKILSLRISALMTLSKFFSTFAVETIETIVIPTLDDSLKLGHEPAILMCVLGVLDKIGKYLSHKKCAELILPRMLPLCVESSLK
eukprot:UN27870